MNFIYGYSTDVLVPIQMYIFNLSWKFLSLIHNMVIINFKLILLSSKNSITITIPKPFPCHVQHIL
jgi:hypothetical protein